MALYRASAIIAAISGKLGGVTFVRNKGSNVVRHRPAGQGGRSIRHEIPAQRLVLLQRLWRTLTANEKTAWATFAAQFPSTNRLGVRRALSAYQCFVRYNIRLLMFQDITSTLPLQVHVSSLPNSMSLTASASGDIFLDFDPTSGPDPYAPLLYGATLNRNSLPRNYHNWRFLTELTTDGAAPLDITTIWAAVWPHPVEGQDIAVRADFYTPLLIPAASFTVAVITAA